MVSRFVEETTDVRTLSAMAMGSLFYRVGRSAPSPCVVARRLSGAACSTWRRWSGLAAA
ncbi:MAG: hypothetical protein U1F57_11305 [bacterium]